MAASTTFLNKILDSGVAGVNAISGIYVGLYSGGSAAAGGGYAHQVISAFDLAVGAIKNASFRVTFAPTGVAAGGWAYDEVRLYSSSTGTLYHSVSVAPAQFIANLDTHNILISFSGS